MMYLIKKLTFFFIFCLFVNSYAQSVKVLDKTTKTPISGVAVFNKSQTKTAITDVNGLVDLESFSSKEAIFFQHISFNLKTIKKSNITNNTVYLEGNELGLDEIIISASNFKQNKREIPKS
ncbi:MAG: TonB-dependent receptor, partial [Flavobacteriaceae bacterium]|nr:TonB-dependent receptor [Flavobacteriaceae bacterium]